MNQPGVDKSAQVEIPGPDTGLEEEGVDGEIWVSPALGHEIKGGDCFAEMTHIDVADQTVIEGIKIGAFLRSERRWQWEFGGSVKREA